MNVLKEDNSLSPNEEKIKRLEEKVFYYEKNFSQLFNYSALIMFNPKSDTYYIYPSNDSKICFEIFPEDRELSKIAEKEYLRRRNNGE